MNVKRIESRVKIDYLKVLENTIDNKSLSPNRMVVWLIKELTVLQKYILELLIDRIETELKGNNND